MTRDQREDRKVWLRQVAGIAVLIAALIGALALTSASVSDEEIRISRERTYG